MWLLFTSSCRPPLMHFSFIKVQLHTDSIINYHISVHRNPDYVQLTFFFFFFYNMFVISSSRSQFSRWSCRLSPVQRSWSHPITSLWATSRTKETSKPSSSTTPEKPRPWGATYGPCRARSSCCLCALSLFLFSPDVWIYFRLKITLVPSENYQ